jgi:serine/threonine-protein kinase RsbW
VTVSQAFRPDFDALAELVSFTARAFDIEGIDRRLLPAVDFALEELFTNIVKYGRSDADIALELRAIPDGVEACLTAEGVADFDPTRAPTRDTTQPVEQRQPGGLGIQLTRRLVDSIEYEYQDTQRRSRVTFRKTLA